MKILVAVDGSAYTKRMLAYLAAHDEWLGPAQRYTIVHASAPLPSVASPVPAAAFRKPRRALSPCCIGAALRCVVAEW